MKNSRYFTDEQNDAKYEVTIVITDGSHSTMV